MITKNKHNKFDKTRFDLVRFRGKESGKIRFKLYDNLRGGFIVFESKPQALDYLDNLALTEPKGETIQWRI